MSGGFFGAKGKGLRLKLMTLHHRYDICARTKLSGTEIWATRWFRLISKYINQTTWMWKQRWIHLNHVLHLYLHLVNVSGQVDYCNIHCYFHEHLSGLDQVFKLRIWKPVWPHVLPYWTLVPVMLQCSPITAILLVWKSVITIIGNVG